VGIYDPWDKDKNPNVLKKIAKASGAEAYFPQNASQLPGVWANIARGIRSQYTLGFTSSKKALQEEYRKVTVVATGKDGKALKVHTREGYRTAAAVLP
jgi:hypothetical protein